MRSVRINRAKWRAGQDSHDPKKSCGYGDTLLINDEGFKCCLGFACQQLSRKPINFIIGRGEPEQTGLVISPFTKRDKNGDAVNTPLVDEAISINDSYATTLKSKEKALIKLFAKYDLDLEFFGEYAYE